jgi:hypothetical protein
MAFPAPAAVLKGPPVTVDVSSLDELKRALGTATPGSVIRLAAGIYQIYADDPYFLVKGVQGLPDRPIVIQGAPAREDGKRGTIIDDGRSLDPMLELQEHYRRPGSRPVELHDLLIQKQFRTERAINCFVFEDVAWLVIENLTVRNCLPAAFVIYGNSRYVTIRSSTLVGAMVPVFAGRYSDHLLIEDDVWTQDPSGYTQDQSGYSGRVDLTPRPGRMWDTIPWGVVHHGSRAYLNGGLVGSLRTVGSIIIRHNIIRNAYNGVRLRANKCPSYEVCGANVEIYDNDFQFIRDNPVEPEDYALNWWIYHNRIYNGHGRFSLDGVSGGPIYIFGNVGWFDDKPAQRCVRAMAQSSWRSRSPHQSRTRRVIRMWLCGSKPAAPSAPSPARRVRTTALDCRFPGLTAAPPTTATLLLPRSCSRRGTSPARRRRGEPARTSCY